MAELQNYQDPSGEFSNRELKYSFWYARNTLFFYQLIVGFLSIVIAIAWGYTLIKFGAYLLNIPKEKQLIVSLKNFANYQKINTNLAAQALSVDSTAVFPGGVNKYDIIAQVSNPNSRFLVKFDYYFIVDGQNSPTQSGFLLPGQSSLFGFFGFTPNAPSESQILLTNIVWERISSKKVPNLNSWQNTRLDFIVDKFAFTHPENVDAASAQAINFTFTNNTAYSYKAANFYAGLYLNDGLVGVIPFQVDNFASQETRNIDLRSFVDNLSVDSARVFPAINIYDPSVYLLPDKQ